VVRCLDQATQRGVSQVGRAGMCEYGRGWGVTGWVGGGCDLRRTEPPSPPVQVLSEDGAPKAVRMGGERGGEGGGREAGVLPRSGFCLGEQFPFWLPTGSLFEHVDPVCHGTLGTPYSGPGDFHFGPCSFLSLRP
jgi:hypothetical protein